MTGRAMRFGIVLVLFGAFGLHGLFAQDLDDVQQGIKAYGTYQGGEFDSISMTNGSLTLNIPVLSYPQRGNVKLGYRFIYNRKTYMQTTSCIIDSCTTKDHLTSIGSPLVVGTDQGYIINPVYVYFVGQKTGFGYSTAVAPDGASHILGCWTSTDCESTDGTGLRVRANGSTSLFLDANGTEYSTSGSGASEDANGNQVTGATSLTDTLGRTVPPYPKFGDPGGTGSCPTGALPVYKVNQWVVPGPGTNGTSTYTYCFAQVSVVTLWDFTDDTQVWGNQNYLQSLVLPNGTAWMFQYSTDGNGDLTQITLPTGGTISYTWADGTSCSGLFKVPRVVASRTVNANDGTGSHTWTYTPGWSGSQATMTVVDPLGNNTVHAYTTFGGCQTYVGSTSYYQGSAQPANLIKTVSTTYSAANSPFGQEVTGTDSIYMNIVPTQITTTWANGKTNQVTMTYDSGFTFTSPRGAERNIPAYMERSRSRKTTTTALPLGAWPLLRQTNTSYVWQSPNPHYTNYLSNNMLNLVYSTQITDGTNQKAYTQYGYDETATTASGLGSAQNFDTAVWTGTYRGNRTSVNRWRNLPTVATLTGTTTYYDTGMPLVAKDPLNNPTTFSYSSTFQDAYVTEVTNACKP